ncbi:glycosyltransferase family 2 protein [Shewanella youngdeokensis]|uniref:Glycosyltransferase family 2 protein n=1 Tax=Shewanella youngdeokensis TaxID=2999068 RepID=A0ABZ0K191_9GAMM|nr:glycosyltransferase family 2 protein [Shewanella sp. DAU334]
MIKKYAMLLVKLCVRCLPGKIKNLLMQNPKLVALYTRLIFKSGILYGEPSAKKMKLYYQRYIDKQSVLSGSLVTVEHNAIILVNDNSFTGLADSLTNAEKVSGLKNVFVWCSSSIRDEVDLVINKLSNRRLFSINSIVGDTLSEAVASLIVAKEVFLLPTIVIKSGVRVMPQILSKMAQFYQVDSRMNASVLYCDSDEYNSNGIRCNPDFKPDWNPDLQLSNGYICDGIWVSSFDRLLSEVPMFYCSDAIADWLCEQYFTVSDFSVGHVSEVLLHSPYLAEKNDQTGFYHDSRYKYRLEANSYLGDLTFMTGSDGIRRYTWPHHNPLVSIIIPTKNAHELVRMCIDSILEKTDYQHYEIILVDNNSDERNSLSYFEQIAQHPKVTILKYPFEFNYSAINNYAVKRAKGSVIALVNNDIEVINRNWLGLMVGHVSRKDIGCVGAKLLYPDNRIQHAGVVLGYGGGAGHAHKYYPSDHCGYMNRIAATQNFSAITAACLLVKRDHYLKVGGLDESLKVAFNDVDFCLRVLELGVRNLYCADAQLYHHESVSRGPEDTPEKQARFKQELQHLKGKWAEYIAKDPAYNSNLTLSRENFALRNPK